MTDQRPVAEVYEAQRREHERDRQQRHRISERLAWARLAAFFGAAVLAWRALSAPDASAGALGAAAGALFLAFLWLVRRHGREKRRVQWLEALASVSAEAAHRARREWSALPVPDWGDAPADHAYAGDLDLHGSASLAQLLPRVSSAPGRDILRSWLLEPATPDEIRARQVAVADLTPQIELRDALTALGRRIWLGTSTQKLLERWAAGEPWLRRRPSLIAASVALPAATLVLGGAAIAGVVSSSVWVIPIAAAALLSAIHGGALRRTLAPVADQADALQGYADMTRLVSSAAFESPLLRELQSEMARGDQPAHGALGSLRTLADCSQVRSSPMLHVALQWLLLWDFHVAHLVERWQQRHGRHLAAWLAALGETESLAALAGLAHGNPRWTFPEVDDDGTALEATSLGHPLLAEDVRVSNDVVVGPAGTFLLVTGSNMSGKSTLLRAIGVNVVLAHAGAPVCATRLRCPPVALHTSMRIRDSLERGVSYFMAEVLRLKQVIDATRAPAGPPRTVLYLFDEMLQGTNAAERAVAAQRIVEFLLSVDAIGALATHDLRLLDSAAVSRAACLVHFREEVAQERDGPTLRFDYRLRPGPASSTNALRLMELAGLPVAGNT
ncbi:MAG: hypothetical protein M3303_00685 [Gemmatimonadota bacterium]|nr:hypothetical protein [Gemmatimonadota bacterium]